MRLYYTSSVCSLAVRIVLHELNLNCEYESVSLKTKITETGKNYLDINPKGSVPALVLDDNSMLTENAVILQYLADTHHATQLLPTVGDMRRYRTLEWLNFVSTDLHRYCGVLFWSAIPAEVKDDVFRPRLYSKLTLLDKHLQQNKYLMGNEFTLGDAYLFVILIWIAKLRIDTSEWPNLRRYFADMKARPSCHEAVREEELQDLNV